MPNKRNIYYLNQSPLYKLRSRSKLASILRISVGDLRRLGAGGDLYREFDIPKKSGGARHVENPARNLKLVQARIARLLSQVTPPDYLYCPVRGRSYVQNAALHAGNRVVRSIDVKKYFPSTRARRVFWFFHKVLRCERDIAGLLTSLTTYQGHLPTGGPASPILAYFAHVDIWEAISRYCEERSITLSVYIDDCTVSGRQVTSGDMWQIKRLIHAGGLRYHKEKAYFDRAAEVTGVMVNDGGVGLPNRQHLKLKNAKEALAASPHDGELRRQVMGLRAQVRQIVDAKERRALIP